MSKDTETMKHNAEVAQSDTIRPNKKRKLHINEKL